MSRGYRGVIAALAGLAAVIAIGMGGWLWNDARRLQTDYEFAAKDAAGSYAHRADIRIKRECAPLAEPRKTECIREEAEAYREGRRNEYDLQAQLVTSAWTRAMGIAAIIGMVASLIGVGLVFITFQATRHANDIAKDTAKQQLRAYVGFHEISADYSGGHWRVSVVWINRGETPAYNVISGFDCRAGRATEIAEMNFQDIGRVQGVTTIAPSQSIVTGSRNLLSNEQLNSAKSLGVYYVFAGWVEYSDTFPDTPRRRTECALIMKFGRNRDDELEMAFLPMDRHNGMDMNCLNPPHEWDAETQQPKPRA